MDMDLKKYRQVSIPTDMFLLLTKLVGHHGFTSTAEVVKWCIRQSDFKIVQWLDEIEKEDVLNDIKAAKD